MIKIKDLIKFILVFIEQHLRIIDTFKDAFGQRLYGFLMMSIIPAINCFYYGYINVGIITIVFWLLYIRITLEDK